MLKSAADIVRSNKRVTNFFMYGFGQAFNLLGPLLVIPYIVSKCGETGFGKVALGISLAYFLILIVDYAFEIKGIKEASEKRDDYPALEHLLNKVYQTKAVLCIISLAIGIVLINSFGFFNDEKPMFYLSLSMVIAQTISPMWFFLGTENLKAVTFINILSKLLYIGAVFIVVKSSADYIYINLLLGATSFIAYITGLVMIRQKYGFYFKRVLFRDIVQTLKQDLNICLSQLCLSARQQAPIFISGIFLGYFVAGQYKIIESIIMPIRTLIQISQRFFYPTLCYKIFRNTTEGLTFWKKYSLANMAMVVAGLIFIYFFSTEILIFFKAEPQTIPSLENIFYLALLIPLLLSITLPLEQLMFSIARNRQYVIITIVTAVVNIVLMLALITKYALHGIIISICIAEILFAAFCTAAVIKHFTKHEHKD